MPILFMLGGRSRHAGRGALFAGWALMAPLALLFPPMGVSPLLEEGCLCLWD